MAEILSTWRCKNGHGLGVVRGDKKGGVLMKYRHAVDLTAEQPVEVDVDAVVEFGMISVRCDICGETRVWAPNQAAYERLMSHYTRQRVTG